MRIAGESAEPDQSGLAAKPCELALGILTRVALRVENRVAKSELAAEILQRLFVAMRLERLRLRRKPECENALHFLHETVLEHGGAAKIEPLVESFAIRQETKLEDAISAQRIAAFLKQLARGSSSQKINFQRARDFRNVVRMNRTRRHAIEASEQAME